MQTSNYYHIFNHANGSDNLFEKPENFQFFLDKISYYLLRYVKLHAYCLMPNHFHLIIYTRDEEELIELPEFNFISKDSPEQLELEYRSRMSKCFSKLFSSYAQAFNKAYARKGSLFMPNVKKNLLESTDDVCTAVHYVHVNPVHHGFVKRPEDWKFSSYNTYFSDLPTKLAYKEIIELYGGVQAFIEFHQQPVDLKIKWE